MNKSIKILFNRFLGPLIFLILSWSLYKQLVNQPDLGNRWEQIKQGLSTPGFVCVCLLMLLNWGLEARKWQLLIAPLEKLSFANSFKSVLAGCSITMLTPNRVGEYGGRILYVKEEHRLDAIPLTILGSISQLFVTLVMGTAGLLFLKFSGAGEKLFVILPSYTADIFLAISISGAVFLMLVYLRVSLLVNLLTRIPVLKKFTAHIILLNAFSRKQLLRILFLSFLRYMVFILQYVLLLEVMQVEISFFTCLMLLTVFYLVMAMAPTIGFTELPLRVAAGLGILQLYSNNSVGIQAASLGIWIINLAVPAITGSLLILGLKIMKEK
ncbi:MAG: lysylphosphatidylglycerol synthase domain-containing protein [Ferruginibacter sp.]